MNKYAITTAKTYKIINADYLRVEENGTIVFLKTDDKFVIAFKEWEILELLEENIS